MSVAAEVKERPVLFSGEMVKALLAGTKTQTRRIIKPQPDVVGQAPVLEADGTFIDCHRLDDNHDLHEIKCPYGKAGDRLWVRETWRIAGWNFEDSTMVVEWSDGTSDWMEMYDPTEDSMWLVNHLEKLENKGYIEPEDPNNEESRYKFLKPLPWKPSIHMPREASRISLEITNIRVERLHDISEQDAISEGIEKYGPFGEFKGGPHPNGGMMKFRAYERASRAFQDLWESINGAGAWKRNPWVWVLEFKQVEP